MKYGEPIEAIAPEMAANRAQFDARIAEGSTAVRTAAVRALNSSSGNTKGVTVADATAKSVMLKADGAKTVTYFSIPAPEVDQQHFNACIDRILAYLQVENDELMIQLGVERLDQNKLSFDARHKTQLKKIDNQISKMREDETASTLSKIFKWIGMAIAIAAAVVASTIVTVMSLGQGSPSAVLVGMLIASAVTSLGSATVMGLDAGGVLEDFKEAKTKEYMQQGMSRKEAAKAASDIIMGISLGSAILNAVVQIATAVVSGGAGFAKDVAEIVRLSQQISQGVIGSLQGLQSIGSGIADANMANAEYNLAVASAEVKWSDARLREAKEFLSQTSEEIQELAERMDSHFRAYRGIIASKAATLLHLAENI